MIWFHWLACNASKRKCLKREVLKLSCDLSKSDGTLLSIVSILSSGNQDFIHSYNGFLYSRIPIKWAHKTMTELKVKYFLVCEDREEMKSVKEPLAYVEAMKVLLSHSLLFNMCSVAYSAKSDLLHVLCSHKNTLSSSYFGNCVVYCHDKPKAVVIPFSFWQSIYVNVTAYSNEMLYKITFDRDNNNYNAYRSSLKNNELLRSFAHVEHIDSDIRFAFKCLYEDKEVYGVSKTYEDERLSKIIDFFRVFYTMYVKEELNTDFFKNTYTTLGFVIRRIDKLCDKYVVDIEMIMSLWYASQSDDTFLRDVIRMFYKILHSIGSEGVLLNKKMDMMSVGKNNNVKLMCSVSFLFMFDF